MKRIQLIFRYRSYGVVYSISNLITGKHYIGQTTYDPPTIRWTEHLIAARSGYNNLLSRAIRKYGEKNFAFEVLWIAFDKNALDQMEDYFINLMGMVPIGYNLRRGGATGKHADSTISQIKATLRGRNHSADILRGLNKPGVRQRHLDAIHAINLRPEVQEKRRLAAIAAYQRPDVQQKVLASVQDPEKNKIRALKRVPQLAGRRWITNGIRSEFLKKGDILPEGWQFGRIVTQCISKNGE